MIEIVEKKANKIPCKTSLFLKLPCYDKELFRLCIHLHGCVYDKKTLTFEFSFANLGFLIEMLSAKDDVKLVLLHEKEEKKKQYKLPKKFEYKLPLYQHQREAIAYGLKHDKWILGDDQGLGKTASIICLAETLKKEEGIEHCLIICGVNSLKYTWKREVGTFSDLDVCILGERITKRGTYTIDGVAKRLEVLQNPIKEFFVVTNMETLQNKEFAKAFKKSKNKFDMIVVDEIHRMKSSGSKSAKTLLALKSKYKVALSGTMIVNSPQDAYIPLKWTGNISSDLSTMNSVYCVYGGFGGKQIIGTRSLDMLKAVMDDCELRRLKEEVLDLPPKTYIKEYVDLLPKQKALYEEVQEKVFESLDLLDHKPSVIEEISMNLRLRQITASPEILSTEVHESAKLQRLEELVNDIVSQGDKVVVFCSFKGTANAVEGMFKKYNAVKCTGDTSNDELEKNKNTFMTDDDCKVLVGTWQKMGTGHTLTAANYLIFVDTPFTDSDFKQSADRIYRIGQKKPCFIITLITKDTYDERVQEIIDTKAMIANFLQG